MGRPLNHLSFSNWDSKPNISLLLQLVSFRIICQPAVFMRRAVLEKVGYLDTSYHLMLDHQLWIRLARLAPALYLGGEAGIDSQPLLAAARYHPAAKNVAQAAQFGAEITRLLAWMATQSDLKTLVDAHRNHVLAGAARLNARYQLEGGFYAPALQFYWKALRLWPSYALLHSHRMVYALAGIIGLNPLLDQFRQGRDRRKGQRLIQRLNRSHPDWRGWPGLHLEAE
jgi:hypothetical protein